MTDVTTDEREALIAELDALTRMADGYWDHAGDVARRAAKALRTQAAPRGEPVATLYRHDESGRERVVMRREEGMFDDDNGHWRTAAALHAGPPVAPQASEPVARTPAAKWREDGEPDPHGTLYDCERAELTLGHLTDDELANAAFMNYDVRPPIADLMSGKAHAPIAYMTAVKDRIRWLSRKLAAAAPQALHAGPPREPTEKMIEAGRQFLARLFPHRTEIITFWQAMYDAWQAQQEPQE